MKFVLAVGINAVLLGVASWELRRCYRTANLLSGRHLVVLAVWTIAEIAVEDRRGYVQLVYPLLMGAIGVSVVTDRAEGCILDVVTLPSCAFAIVAESSKKYGLDSMMGALAVSGAMLLLYAVTRGRGLGLGDVKLAAVTGALLGAESGLFSLGVSFVLGGCVAAFLIVCAGANRRAAVPFAPYIAAGTLGVLALTPA